MDKWQSNVSFVLQQLNTAGGHIVMLVGGVTVCLAGALFHIQNAERIAELLAGALLAKLRSEG